MCYGGLGKKGFSGSNPLELTECELFRRIWTRFVKKDEKNDGGERLREGYQVSSPLLKRKMACAMHV